MSRRIIYIGWVDQGNLGDDLCRDIFIEEINKYEGNSWSIETVSPQQINANDFIKNRPDLVVLGGGSLVEPYYLVTLLWAQEQGIPTAVWGSGVDNLSPEMLDRIQSGEKLDRLQVSKADLIRHVINNCEQVGVRGPHTLNYLQALGCSENLEVSGDPGLLLSEPVPGAYYEQLFGDDTPAVGINWGTSQNRLFGGSERKVRRQLARVVRELALDFKVILYAVWPPDLTPLSELANEAGTSKNVMVCNSVPSLPFLCTLLKGGLFTINFKLHANVFTAAMGNPFICLGYRSKCFDFAESLEVEDLVISTGAENLAEQILSVSQKIVANPEHYRRRISGKRDFYCNKLRHLTHKCVHLPG
ncbi:MAG: polysaccharide pyruvyl transferase family protein [Candidatus Contubernalis sp.]|nr:polysaccharide pyruvyl transferase family protein [Candidatus Contubernalis sp.]